MSQKPKPLRRVRKFKLPGPAVQYDYAASVSFDQSGINEASNLDPLSSANLAHTGECSIGILTQRAAAGDADAAWSLARLAFQATRDLTRICGQSPGLLIPFGRSRHSWPVIKRARDSRNAHEQDLFAKIQLGQDALIELDQQSSKWKMDEAGKMAYHLIRYIQRGRTGPLKGLYEIGAGRKLKPFSDDTARDWWEVARGVLLLSYPTPETVPELNNLVTAASKRKSPGRIKQAIFDLLKARFLSFARNTSYQS